MPNLIERWSPKDGLYFDDEALNIIKSNHNISILAGPGAGKTEILAQRACFLLETNVVLFPRNILSISRKRESASNIKSRVELRCGRELSARFHSYTIEAFTKSLLDRFSSILPDGQRPNSAYTIAFNPSHAKFPNSLSFDQITNLANKIIELSPEIVKIIRATYSHIFIDEFQDLNGPQYTFIKSLFSTSQCVVTAVGDTKQAIMKFAHALPDVFIKFNVDFQSKFKMLTTNHRSSPELKIFLDELGKKWWPHEDSGYGSTSSPMVQLSSQDYMICCYKDDQEEAVELSKLISRWINTDKIRPNDIAVLFRANPNGCYSAAVIDELLKLNIISVNESNLQDHLSEPLGRIILCMLILLTRPRDAKYWEELQNLYIYVNGGQDGDIDKLEYHVRAIITYLDSNRLVDGVTTNESIRDLIIDFIEHFFWGNICNAFPQYNQGNFAGETILGIISELEKIKNRTKSWKEAVDILSGKNAVRMMTIHKSKGLEFEAVILLGFEDHMFFRGEPTESKIDEERSTIFVALSRAKSKLWISASKDRSQIGNTTFRKMRTIIDDLTACGLSKKVI